MFKVNNKNTRKTFSCIHCQLCILFAPFLLFLVLTFNKTLLNVCLVSPYQLKNIEIANCCYYLQMYKILVKQKLIRDCDPKQGTILNRREPFFFFRVQSYNLYFTKVVLVNHSLMNTVFFRRALATTNCKYTMYFTVISIKVRCYFKETLATIHSSGTVIVSGRHLQ